MSRSRLRFALFFAVLLPLPLLRSPVPAHAATDPVAKCKGTIATAASAYLKATQQALRTCREKVVAGKIPHDTSCGSETKTKATLDKAKLKLVRAIASACGGDDKTCGTPDDEPLASIGWDVGNCPGFFTGSYFTLPIPNPIPFPVDPQRTILIRRAIISCRGAIATCADVATCVGCLADVTVNQVSGLLYNNLTATDAKTDKARRKCQLTISKESLKFLTVQSTALAKCWDAVGKGKGSAPCPDPGDGKAAATIAQAELAKATAICKACGGTDKSCGGLQDETASSIGFVPTCPAIGGCERTIASLGDLTTCLDCITNRDGRCTDLGTVPAAATYPNECGHAPTPTPAATPGADKLDYQAAAKYGEANLSNGFSPDPYSVGMTSGGTVNVSYLGGSCSGFATSAPDLRINFGGGGASLLRLYFVGSNGDPTMVINDPYGNFYCVDDSFGTVNPTIDFNNPAGGSYDVWIGSYASNATISGTFYITESSGNHP
jgi:hypothetical protein